MPQNERILPYIQSLIILAHLREFLKLFKFKQILFGEHKLKQPKSMLVLNAHTGHLNCFKEKRGKKESTIM